MSRRKEHLPAFVATPAELGAAIRAARTSMGLSIEQAATLADVPPRLQMDIENGAGDIYLIDALRVASLCGLELLAQARGTMALQKILSGESPVAIGVEVKTETVTTRVVEAEAEAPTPRER